MNLSSKAESLFDALDSTIDYDHGTAYHAAVDDLIAYIAELEAERAWRPIETAQEYAEHEVGKSVLVIREGFDAITAFQLGGEWFDVISGSPVQYILTHWMPLPEPTA